MTNIQGKKENLELFNSKGVRAYKFLIDSDGFSEEFTYDEKGNELTYKDSDGCIFEWNYDEKGNEITFYHFHSSK